MAQLHDFITAFRAEIHESYQKALKIKLEG